MIFSEYSACIGVLMQVVFDKHITVLLEIKCFNKIDLYCYYAF